MVRKQINNACSFDKLFFDMSCTIYIDFSFFFSWTWKIAASIPLRKWWFSLFIWRADTWWKRQVDNDCSVEKFLYVYVLDFILISPFFFSKQPLFHGGSGDAHFFEKVNVSISCWTIKSNLCISVNWNHYNFSFSRF
jgi:hypothetical protein